MATRKKKPVVKKKSAAKKKPVANKKKPAVKKTRPSPVKREREFDSERTQKISLKEIIGDIEERQALDRLGESK